MMLMICADFSLTMIDKGETTMKMKSKIKTLFSSEIRHELAAICDTKRIESNTEKMDLLVRLMRYKGISFDILGGATNRIVIMMDGYAIKLAVDSQGYKDNWMEYALSMETQPYTTKSYETNGYMLVQCCVRLITIEEWRVRKAEIIKILDALSSDYLLGDVGYCDINMANWGVRDDGSLVILDYAYCHRLTEQLFTCPVCGSILSYDMNYVSFLCTDRANCHEHYSYNDIKSIQGDAVDWEMIEEKKRESVLLSEGVDVIEVNRDSDILLDDRTMLIRSYRDLELYKEAKKMTKLDMSNPELLYYLAKSTLETLRGNEDYAKELLSQVELSEEEMAKKEQLNCIIDPTFAEKMEYESSHHGRLYTSENYNEKEDDKIGEDDEYSLENILQKLSGQKHNVLFEGNTSISFSGEEEQSEDNAATIRCFNVLSDLGIDDEFILPSSSRNEMLDTSIYAVDHYDVEKLKNAAKNVPPAPIDVLEEIESITEGNGGEETEGYGCAAEENCGPFIVEGVDIDPQSGKRTEQVLICMTGESPIDKVVLDQNNDLRDVYASIYAEE